MKRKLLTVLLTLATVLCLCFGLVGCDKKNDDHGSADQNADSDAETDLWTVERLYAEAQAKGFEGSLDDLIALFKGDTGDQGPKGDKGDTGDAGSDGKDGIGVKSVEIDENGHLKITLTTAQSSTRGKSPPTERQKTRARKVFNSKRSRVTENTPLPSSVSGTLGTRTSSSPPPTAG